MKECKPGSSPVFSLNGELSGQVMSATTIVNLTIFDYMFINPIRSARFYDRDILTQFSSH